jgi:hypothetical protein
MMMSVQNRLYDSIRVDKIREQCCLSVVESIVCVVTSVNQCRRRRVSTSDTLSGERAFRRCLSGSHLTSLLKRLYKPSNNVVPLITVDETSVKQLIDSPYTKLTRTTIIMFTTLEGISESQKQELIAGLATLLVGSAAEPELTAEKLQAVASASGNTLSPAMASLFASTVQEVKPYVMSPGGGGGGGGGGTFWFLSVKPSLIPASNHLRFHLNILLFQAAAKPAAGQRQQQR